MDEEEHQNAREEGHDNRADEAEEVEEARRDAGDAAREEFARAVGGGVADVVRGARHRRAYFYRADLKYRDSAINL